MENFDVSGETEQCFCDKNLHVLNVSPVLYHVTLSKAINWASLNFHWLKYDLKSWKCQCVCLYEHMCTDRGRMQHS